MCLVVYLWLGEILVLKKTLRFKELYYCCCESKDQLQTSLDVWATRLLPLEIVLVAILGTCRNCM